MVTGVTGKKRFEVILKNARSLSTDERLEEVVADLGDTNWDAIMFNETWRACREEFDELASGHIWFGSGGDARKHGVGILLHKRWAGQVHRWTAISMRVGVLEMNAGKTKMSLIVAYLPHCGYNDEAVQEVI